MIKEAIKKILAKSDLTQGEAEGVMSEIMSGAATPAQIAGFLVALSAKGESISEIVGSVKAIRAMAAKVNLKATPIVDTCGTGGDNSGTFNISTCSTFVVAGAGLTVAKHGNRSVSSKCGSADVFEALGVKIDIPPGKVEECINEVGMGFMFAPNFHPAMKYALAPRKEIGVRTIFNILGPLCNPAGATAQVIGVFDEKLTEMMAEVLLQLGVERALVVHGMDGVDEISLSGHTKISELKAGKVNTYFVEPRDFGLQSVSANELLGGDAKYNANIITEILDGKKGAKRDVVLANSAAAIIAGGKAKSFSEAVRIAATSIDSGKAKEKLNKLKEFTNA